MAARKDGRGYKVWLVTWDWDGEHAKPEWGVIEAILPPRLRSETVRWFVEQRHAQRIFTLREQLRIAIHPNANTFRAQFARPWEVRITCGDNPFLYARLVEDFRVGDDGAATWRELPIPELVTKAWARQPPFDTAR